LSGTGNKSSPAGCRCVISTLFVRARIGRARFRKGAPDFHVLHDRKGICLEFKREGERLTEDQEAVHRQLERNRVPHFVVADAGEAIRLTQKFFEL
jgi:hypothetical protein